MMAAKFLWWHPAATGVGTIAAGPVRLVGNRPLIERAIRAWIHPTWLLNSWHSALIRPSKGRRDLLSIYREH